MAVSPTVKRSFLGLCELCEGPWTEAKVVEKIRAFRADSRDSDGAISAEELANMMCSLFATALMSPHALERRW